MENLGGGTTSERARVTNMGLVSVSSPSPQLSLDLKPPCSDGDNDDNGYVWTPGMISGFLRELSIIPDSSERLSRIDEFLGRLEQEYVKIQVFQRELPLCMLLLNDAILSLKEESRRWKKKNTDQKPVLEEFMPVPMKETREELPRKKAADRNNDDDGDLTEDSGDKKDNWLQLWSAENCPAAAATYNNTLTSEKQGHNLLPLSLKVDGKRRRFTPDNGLSHQSNNDVVRGGEEQMRRPVIKATNHIFPVSFKKIDNTKLEKMTITQTTPPDAGLSLGGIIKQSSHHEPLVSSNPRLSNGRLLVAADSPSDFVGSSNVVNSNSQQHQHPTNRKQRRCWSPELHRRFVNALQQLGGAQVATPKQIRELMQVDGLTNDEVKSHLQKYRLHTRRAPGNTSPSQEQTSETTTSKQQQQQNRSSSPLSGSPESPFHFGLSRTSTTGGDSMEDHEESEGYS